MRTNHRSNALLVELLIVVMFFMLASTLLIRIFGTASQLSARAELLAEMTSEAQNIADTLLAAADPEEEPGRLGFTREGALWVREEPDARLEITSLQEERDTLVWYRQEVTARDKNGEALISLPVSRFVEVSP